MPIVPADPRTRELAQAEATHGHIVLLPIPDRAIPGIHQAEARDQVAQATLPAEVLAEVVVGHLTRHPAVVAADLPVHLVVVALHLEAGHVDGEVSNLA